MRNRLVVLALAATMASSPALADAVLSGVSGPVLVNQGRGFVPARAGITLADTDQVVARAGGSAVVACGNGASVSVGPGRIASGAQCMQPAGRSAPKRVQPHPDQIAWGQDVEVTGAIAAAGVSPMIVAGAVAAGVTVVAGVVVASGVLDNPPISP